MSRGFDFFRRSPRLHGKKRARALLSVEQLETRWAPAALVSLNVAGTDSGNNASGNDFTPSVSTDGRYVAFHTFVPPPPVPGSNLSAGGGRGLLIHWRDVQTGVTKLVSPLTTDGISLTTGGTYSLSRDGRYMAYSIPGVIQIRDMFNDAAPLEQITHAVTGGENHSMLFSPDGQKLAFTDKSRIGQEPLGYHLFVYDRASTNREIVDVAFGTSVQANDEINFPANTWFDFSGNGNRIVFNSSATNLVATPDNNNQDDVFVRDLVTKTTFLVSMNAAGTATGNATSAGTAENNAHLTPDGRHVVFVSQATDLVAPGAYPDDINNQKVFLRDLQTGTTTLLSVNAAGTVARGRAAYLSGDGRYVVFKSSANLLPGTSFFQFHLYRRDLQTGELALVSANTSGTYANDNSGLYDAFFTNYGHPTQSPISNDGRYIAFVSDATDLVAGLTNGNGGDDDVFVRDMTTGTTFLASHSTTGPLAGGNDNSKNAVLSSDGRRVLFASQSSNLVAADSNATWDVFHASVPRPPVLAPLGNRSVTEANPLTFTAEAQDPDGDALTFSLAAGAPAGAAIDATTGIFTWTPTAAQGPGTYDITVRVTDNGTPALSDSETIQVTVNDAPPTNQAPTLQAIGNRTIFQGNLLTFTAQAQDADGNGLTFSLDAGAPAGAAIHATTGVFTWTPTGSQGPGAFNITVRVTDNGNPPLSASETIQVAVVQVPLIGDRTLPHTQPQLTVNLPAGAGYQRRQAGSAGWFADTDLNLDYVSYNDLGAGEEWFRGVVNQFNNPWYLLKANGDFLAWDGSAAASGPKLFDLDPVYWYYPAMLENASPEHLAFAIDQYLGLRTDSGNLWENFLGLGERWLLSAAGSWYYLTPDGGFHLANSRITTLDPIYHGQPERLHSAAPGQVDAVLNTDATPSLVVTAANDFVGAWVVELTANTGAPQPTVQRFTVSVVNRVPALAAIGNQTMATIQDTLTIPVTTSDPDPGDTVFLTVQAGHSGFKARSDFGLTAVDTFSYFGQNERWFKGNVHAQTGTPWYYLLPNGQLLAWGPASNIPLVTLDPIYHAFPRLLYQANATDLATALRAAHVPFWDNSLGQNERWLRDADTGIWYYLLPNGQVLRENGLPVSNLGAAVYTNLPNGQPALFTAAVAGSNVVVDPSAGFTGDIWVLVEASDINPANRRRALQFFKVTVT